MADNTGVHTNTWGSSGVCPCAYRCDAPARHLSPGPHHPTPIFMRLKEPHSTVGKGPGSEVGQKWVQSPAPSLASCVTVDKRLDVFKSYLHNGLNHSTTLWMKRWESEPNSPAEGEINFLINLKIVNWLLIKLINFFPFVFSLTWDRYQL